MISEDSDKTAWMRRLILGFAGHISLIVGFVMPWSISNQVIHLSITKTRLYNFDPLKPHFYIIKLGFTGVYISFLISAQKHR